ncbi:unnamed protein product [Aspergillus oryzae]|nr:unnamed protein product [Aspergillus oryzae]
MAPSYRGSSTFRSGFNLYLAFLLCAIFIFSDTTFAYSWLPPRRENSPKPTPTQSGNATALTAVSTATIEYSSAVAIESKVSYQLSQLATVPAIPLPTDLPDYDILNQVVGLMPPLQTGSVQNNSVQMLAAMRDNLRSSENSTTGHLHERATGLKVMIVGDSISQGREGDFTWRGGYAKQVSSDFPKSHFAVWGRAAAVDKGLIKEVMAAHPADLMLLLLGFNDMGWFYSDSIGTLDSIHTLISNARAANPKIKFAIANVPQRSFIGGREDLPVSTNIYNSLLRDTIPKWSTTASPIHPVELEENYNCQPSSCPVGSDGLHPNAMGEYQIARAFSQTLVKDFRIGSSALSIPNDVPARPLPVPSNFKVFTSPGGVTATWDPGSVSSNRWDATWPIDGWEYEVQVRASAGDTIKRAWTTTLTATAHPQTAEAPQNVIVSATTTGFDISWDPPTGTSAHIENLVAGHRYFVAVVTWNAAGQGFPAVVRSVIPGAGTPPPPTDLKIIVADQTTVHLTWDSLSAAAGYRLWLRNVNATGSKLEALNYTVEAACSDQYYLFPGTWNYEWCVSAFNGNAESAKGKCVLAPSPDEDGGAAPTYPPAPQWCPNGGSVGGGSGGGGSGGGGDSGGGSSSSSSGGTTEEPWPVVTNGQCKGPDCKNGQCTGLLCASFGCSGSGCLNGVCTAFGQCTVHGCLGSGCRDGVCVADDCITAGCVGDDCGEDGKCTDDRCFGLGCSGSDCGKDGICTGPDCWEGTCSGSGCANGVCSGSKCSSYDSCVGKDCNNGSCKGDDCSSCSGSDCHDGDCTGDNCIGCTGPDCHNGQCTGSNCYGCTGRDCHHGACRGEHCSSCVGSDCVVSNGKSGCKGEHCTSCTGPGCSCFGLGCACSGSGCSGCTGLGCSCTGLFCSCTGPTCTSCRGLSCMCREAGGCSGGEEGGGGGDDDGSTPTDPSCSIKETATICAEYCTVTTNAAATTTTSCTSTTCMPTVGCSVTGTTTRTITSTSSADCPFVTDPVAGENPSDNCRPCAWAFGSVSDVDMEGNLRIRDGFQPNYATITARAVAPTHAGLEKRAPARTSTALGDCRFTPGASVTIPAYKGPQNYVQSAIGGALPASLSMSRWYSKTTVDCAPTITMISDEQVQPFLGNDKQSPTIEHCCKYPSDISDRYSRDTRIAANGS